MRRDSWGYLDVGVDLMDVIFAFLLELGQLLLLDGALQLVEDLFPIYHFTQFNSRYSY
jgi:hypothetical protein